MTMAVAVKGTSILVNRHVATELAPFRHGEGCFQNTSEHSNFPCVRLFYDVPVGSYKVRNLL